MQGGPHNNAIGALAVQLKEVGSPQWQQYAQQVKLNAAALGAFLKANNQKIVTDGTDNHLVLWDLRPIGLTGSKMEAVCDVCAITINKNTVRFFNCVKQLED
jgi:glycine hydroxymethyltransferase